MRSASKVIKILGLCPLRSWRHFFSVGSSDSKYGQYSSSHGCNNITKPSTDHIQELISFYADNELAHVNLNDMVRCLENSRYDPYIFCHRQLPLLLARMIKNLQDLPRGLSSMPSINFTKMELIKSFGSIVNFDVPTDHKMEKKFVETLTIIDERHSKFGILTSMATGVLELKTHLMRHKEAIAKLRERCLEKQVPQPSRTALMGFNDEESVECNDTAFADEIVEIQERLDFFNRHLVQYNFISRQLIEFCETVYSEEFLDGKILKDDDNCLTFPRPSGKTKTWPSLESVVRHAANDAKDVCEMHYGDSPDVIFNVIKTSFVQSISRELWPMVGISEEQGRKKYLSSGLSIPAAMGSSVNEGGFVYPHIVPTFHYIIVELLKNAYRATIEKNYKVNSMKILTCSEMPPIKISLNCQKNLRLFSICIEDLGGGIRRSHMPYVMSYGYTTSRSVLMQKQEDQQNKNITQNTVPMAGYGYGLPLSRTYARSFGGDLLLHSIEGYGTKVFLFLQSAQM